MYRMAVCDDEEAALEYIASSVQKCFENASVPLEIDTYSDPVRLENRLMRQEIYDILLLDIDMSRLNGIELCRRFRADSGDSVIVFISNKEELVFQTFEVQPFRFVRKKYFSREVDKLCRDLIAELKKRQEQWVYFEDRQGEISAVSVQKLMYIEARGKMCRLVSAQHESEIAVQFQAACARLLPFGFIQIHRSYLVNPSYIYRIAQDQVLLDNGETILLSRRRREQVKNQFLAWSRGRT